MPSLPEGVTVEAVYDRSDLIYRAIDTLKRTLIEESVEPTALEIGIAAMKSATALIRWRLGNQKVR